MTSKTEIKEWLKKIGRNRQWLADQLGVSKYAINNYLSTSIDIPSRAAGMISKLMQKEDQDSASIPVFIPEEFVAYVQQESARMHQSIDEFCAHLIARVLGDMPGR